MSADSPHPRMAALVRERGDVLGAVALGGALGSLGRWSVAELVPHAGAELPWSTWLVNVVGAFLLGVLTVLVTRVGPGRRYLRPFVGVGVLGGFTTFSTAVLDARAAYADGSPAIALLGLLGTLVTALPAAWAGLALTRRIVRPRS